MSNRILENHREESIKFASLVGRQNLTDDLKKGIEQATTVDELYASYDKFLEGALDIIRAVARVLPVDMYLKNKNSCIQIIQILDSFGLEEEMPKLIKMLIDKENMLNNAL